MERIKIIELFTRIAKGEEVPKKIKYRGIIYNWDIHGYLHYEDSYMKEKSFLEGIRPEMVLNDTVEIIEPIEKDDNIEKLISLSGYDSSSMSRHYAKINEIINKINELVDRVNDLLKKD